MRKFFKDTYQNNNENLVYHFDKKEVIDEFFEKISIIKLLSSTEAISDPIDLRMYLPINTGTLKNLIFLGDIKFLRFGRLLLLVIHELLGHLLRRYYFYLSNGEVSQDTIGDKKMNWGNEGGKYTEKYFLGKEFEFISVSDILSLLIPKKDYPIISKGNLTLENVKYVISEYRELFSHISLENNSDNRKISVDSYYRYLTIPPFALIKSNIYSYTSYLEI